MLGHRETQHFDFDELKKEFDFRCATCGSKENERNYRWPDVITQLQPGHMDPNKPPNIENIIPQCQMCNRGDRNRWVYDKKGRVIKIANATVILSCDDFIQREVYRLLIEKFGTINE